MNPSFSTDLVGAYTAELWVTNSLGLRSAESCTTTITVAAAEDFRIELYWTYPEDVDLHLSRAGLGGLGTDNDCYYGNCTFGGLAWGGGGAEIEVSGLDRKSRESRAAKPG